ncbi:hypothetical protein [Streptomyces shaanxiensis]|uniref:Class I SAM-dependent methyltransferase n=1 Tax=Streptomyces shaanxiensis TaxID=653357 RepID=A0ABP7V5E2_9ACTN
MPELGEIQETLRFDLDLPDVMTLRRAFFQDTDRRHTLAASVTDPAWAEAVRASPGPYFLVAEAVLVHLDEDQVRSVFDLVAERLPGAELTLETASSYVVDRQDVLRAMTVLRRREIESYRLNRYRVGDPDRIVTS